MDSVPENLQERRGELPDADAPRDLAVAGNRLHIFVESPPLIAAMVRDIAAARRRVWLESYIFSADAAGQMIAAALRQRAAAGVDVRVLYDAVGSQDTPTAFFAALQKAGIQVHAFHTVWESLWSFQPLSILNRRNHRKLLVVDEGVGYFGGMNIINAGTAQARVAAGAPAVPSTGWRDVHIRLEGPQQADLADSFDRSWRRARGQKVQRRPRSYRRGVLPAAAEAIRFFDSGPGARFSRASRIFGTLIRRTRREMIWSMAYFVPVGRVLRALLQARRRGVRLRVIVPGQSDVKLVQYASAYLYALLLRRGFKLYERDRRMLHSKVLVADARWTVVGSCNMDARSLRINLEFLAVIRSRRFARAMLDICDYEQAHSTPVTLATWEQSSWWERLQRRAAWTLRWWL